jgi:putative aldouronate transport system substrate-binding protein
MVKEKTMKKFVFIIVALLGATMLFASGQQGDSAAASGMEISAPGVYPIVTEPVTLTALVPQRSGTPDWNSNQASVFVEEVTGVKIDYQVAPNFNQAVTLAVASAEYPDFAAMASIPAADVMKYGPQGILIPLNDLIDEHAIWTKKMFATDPGIRDIITTPDGNIYGLPNINDDLHGVYGPKMWMNQQWLDNLGLDMPTTTDELYTVLKAFKTQDPNGNGKADEIPYSGAVNGWRAQIPGSINNSFLYVNINTKGLYMENGRMAYAFTQDAYRESLRFHAKLYKEGLIDPAAFTQEGNQLRQLGEYPEVDIMGAAEGGWWNVFTINGGDSGRYRLYNLVPPLEGPDGFKTTGFYKYKTNRDQFNIFASCEYPEIAIKWADYIMSPEGGYNTQYGPEGVGWIRPDAGKLAISGEPAKFIRLQSQETVNFNWGFGGPRYQPYLERLGEQVADDFWDPSKLMTRLCGETLSKYVGIEAPDSMIVPPIYLDEAQNSEISLVETALDSYRKEASVRFVIGDLDVNSDWDDYLDEMDKAGLDRWLELYQIAYGNQFK